MKIRLKRDVPVEAKHGLTAGRIVEVVGAQDGPRQRGGYWVIGDTGERVLVKFQEAEEQR